MSEFEFPIPEQAPYTQLEGLSNETRSRLVSREDEKDISADWNISDAALEWAKTELEAYKDNAGFSGWSDYNKVLETPAPQELRDLARMNKSVGLSLEKLFFTKQMITRQNLLTSEGQNVGDTLHLVLIPWDSFKANIDEFGDYLGKLRRERNLYASAPQQNSCDKLDVRIDDAMAGHDPFYRHPDTADQFTSARNYLNERMRRDGPWGVMLAQTSNSAGIKEWENKEVSEVIEANKRQRLTIGGEPVDGLGVFEWLALTLQENASFLSTNDFTLLPANLNLTDPNRPRIILGRWIDAVETRFCSKTLGNIPIQPRLAVL